MSKGLGLLMLDDWGSMFYGMEAPIDQSFEFYGGGSGIDPYPSWGGGIIDYAPGFGPGDGSDPYFDWLDQYLEQGYDTNTADRLAQEAASDPFKIISSEKGPPQLPEVGPSPILPVPDTFWMDRAWTPPAIEEQFEYFELPQSPQDEAKLPCAGRTPDGYPPVCQSGYGRGPYGSDPCVCYPLPPPRQQTTQPKQDQKQQSQQPAPRPRPAPPPPPPQQQQTGCQPGYCRHPQTGQWIPTPTGYYCHPQAQICYPRCTTPGTVFDQATGQCVPREQATSPVPGSQPEGEEPIDDLFAQLKELPWWVWAALAGVVVLGSQKGDGGSSPARRRSR